MTGEKSMGKVEVSIPHCIWRSGRPRFQPGPKLRALGLAGRDLCDVPPREAKRHDVDPRWWSLAEVERWIRTDLVPSIAAAEEKARGRRIKGKVAAALGAGHTAGPTVADLVEWTKSREGSQGRALAPKSVKFYGHMADTLAAEALDLWTTPARAVRTAQIHRALQAIRERRSIHVAAGVRALLARAWREAVLDEWGGITADPTTGLRLPTPKGRLRAATVPEIRALVAAADALGRPEIGDAIVFGALCGQRQGDRLTAEKTALKDGWLKITQQKTGAVVEIWIGDWLRERLVDADARRADWPVAPLNLVLNEPRRRPFAELAYNRAFNAIRDAAVAGIEKDGAVILAATPSLDGFRDQDLRDTFVTWSIEEGMTAEQIAAVTGHSYRTVQSMIDRHYAARTRPQAKAVADRIDIKIRRGT